MPKKKIKLSEPNPLSIYLILILILIAIVILFLFKNGKPSETSIVNQGPVIIGVYTGNLPCADCPEIKEKLVLTASDSAGVNGSYVLEDQYLEKNPSPVKTIGSWEVLPNSVLKLNPEDLASQPSYYQVLPNGNLQVLDSNMKIIDSPYNNILEKQLNFDR